MSFPVGVLVDDDVAAALGGYRWYAHEMGNRGKKMVWRVLWGRSKKLGRKQKNIYLHQEIMQPPEGMEVDHINGNTLDNRRDNLRVVHRGENAQNMTRTRKDNTSGYRGVTWNRERSCWQAQVQFEGRYNNLGRFADKEEAARVAAEWRREHMPFSEMDKVAV